MASQSADVALFPLNGKIGTPPPLAWVVGCRDTRPRVKRLARDGAKDMRGDLDMGDHNIAGQGLNTDDVDLLNQMSALN